ILNSKKALHKFNEIINAQGRLNSNLKLAKRKFNIRAGKSGIIKSIYNPSINHLARLLGSPADKGSGIYLYKHLNDKIKKGEPVLTLYSESRTRLRESMDFYKKSQPIIIN
ncbi:MAG: hypothetical protein HYT62_01170, partial [Candidatus Yanofskybacteria bacterium]|nr:hypothetical protein [Candidatus Yanofskybacteria bacterium]